MSSKDDKIKNESNGARRCLEYLEPYTVERSTDVAFFKDDINYNEFDLLSTLNYFEALFCDTTEMYKKVLYFDRVIQYGDFASEESDVRNLSNHRFTYFLYEMEKYSIDAFQREWRTIRENFELKIIKKENVKLEDIEEIWNIINELRYYIKDKIKEIEKINYEQVKKMFRWIIVCKHTLNQANIKSYINQTIITDFTNYAWNGVLHTLRLSLNIGHERFGLVIVPRISKIRLVSQKYGLFECVELGLNNKGEPVVVKHMKNPVQSIELTKAVTNSRIDYHKNVLKYRVAFGRSFIVFTPLMELNLGQNIMFLSNNKQLNIHAYRMTKELVDGLSFLHNRNIIHGNLKPTNILFDNSGTLKISEFGLGSVIRDNCLAESTCLIWQAREHIVEYLRESYCECSLAGDVATAGMIIHYILSHGRHPYGIQIAEILENIIENFMVLTIQNIFAIEIITKMLVTNPKSRVQIQEVARLISAAASKSLTWEDWQ